MNVLITGGAGFIGTHLTRRLLRDGYAVTVFDSFLPQIHGDTRSLPADIRNDVELVVGDVCDSDTLHGALRGKDVVVHLAAETGTGQSMYEVVRYQSVNIGGTANLMDYLVNSRESAVRKVVVASSRAIYGEGKYRCAEHGVVYPENRRAEEMKAGIFDPLCPLCSAPCVMLPTDELSLVHPASFYGLSKQVQEQMVLMYARTLGISGYALRYQNVYGPGQSLNNPYTGILAIFSTRARQGLPINIFEDGRESRDFVYIADVIEATARCIDDRSRGVGAFNVGSGVATTVLELAENIVPFFNSPSELKISGDFRIGDIRHNVADIAKITAELGFRPEWAFEKGLAEFLSWAQGEKTTELRYHESLDEMKRAGLFHSADQDHEHTV